MQTASEPIATASEPCIACDLNAIPSEARAEHVLTAHQLFALAQSVNELADGIEFLLPGDSETLIHAARFISRERECCPFLTFTLEAKHAGEPLRLQLTGGAGVKEFLLSELG